MTTDLVHPPAVTRIDVPPPILPTIAVGLFGGCLLGIVARAWMRLIAEDPEFTWTGTLFIVAGFTLFGLGQAIVAVVRSRARRRRWRAVARRFGTIAMLPLFTAAGSVMLPTVIGGGLALARTRWHWSVRTVLLLVAAAPVVFVGRMLVDAFDWSLHTLTGFVLLLAIYATIIWATRCTFAPTAPVRVRRYSD